MEQFAHYFFIFDIVVLVGLILTVLFGLIKGVKRSIHRLITLILPIIIVFPLMTPITRAIASKEIVIADYSIIMNLLDSETKESMGDTLNEPQSVKIIISKVIYEKVYENDPTMDNSKLADLAESMAVSVLKIAMYGIFLLLIFLLDLVFRLIFLIIRKFMNIKLNRTKHGLGALVGVARFGILFFLIFLPLLGTMKLAAEVSEDILEYKEEVGLDEDTYNNLSLYSGAVNNSITEKVVITPLTSIFCKDKEVSFDAQYVAKALNIETSDGNKTNLRDEYLNLRKALPVVLKIYKQVSNGNGEIIKLSEYTPSEIEAISKTIKDSGLLKLGLPALVEVGVYNLKKQYPEFSKYLTKLEGINWNDEIEHLSNVILVIKNHLDIEIDTTNVSSMLTSNSVIDLAHDMINEILSMGLITKVAVPIGVDYGLSKAKEDERLQAYDIDYDSLSNIDWETNLKSVVDFAFEVYDEYLKLDIDITEPKEALGDEEIDETIKKLFNDLAEVDLLVDNILPIGLQILFGQLDMDGIDVNSLKTLNWRDELPVVGNVLASIIVSYQNLGLDYENFTLDDLLKNTKLPDELNNVVDELLTSKLVSEYLLPFGMDKLFDSMESNEGLNSFGFDFEHLRSYNYKDEISSIKDVLIEVIKAYQGLEFNKDNWQEILDKPELETYLNNIADKALLSNVIKNDILPALSRKLNDLVSNYEGSMDISFLKELLADDSLEKLLDNDISNIVSLVKNLKNIGIFDKDFNFDINDSTTQDALCDTIKGLFGLSIMSGHEASIFDGIINMVGLNDALGDIGITVDTSKVTNWESEIDNFVGLIKDVIKLTGGLEDSELGNIFEEDLSADKKELIAGIVEKFSISEAMGDSIYDMIDKLIGNFDESFRVTLTPIDKEEIKNVTGWHTEVMVILDILSQAKSIDTSGDYAALDPDMIESLLNRASDGVLATKIVGKLLTEMLTGVTDFDFSTRAALKASAGTLKELIIIANIASQATAIEDSNNIDDVVDALRTLGSSDEGLALANDLLGNVTGESLTIDQEDLNSSADVIDEIYQAYEDSPDPDNFKLDDLSAEQKEKLENNPLAKALLSMWFE